MLQIVNKVLNTERAKVRRWIFVAWCIGVCCKRREEEVEGLFSFSPLPKPLSHDAYRTSKGDWEELSPSFFFFFAFAALAAFQNSFQLRKELTLTDSYFVGNAHTKPNQYPYFQRDFLFKASLRNFFFVWATSLLMLNPKWIFIVFENYPKFYHFEFWRQNPNVTSTQSMKITEKVSYKQLRLHFEWTKVN